MQVRDLPAKHGWLWIKQGYELFRKAPLVWLTVSAVWSFFLSVFILRPLSAFVLIIFYPALLAVWLRVCKQIDERGAFDARVAFAGLGKSMGKLLNLGAIIILGQMLLSLVASLIAPVDPELSRLVGKYPEVRPRDLEDAAPHLVKFMLIQLTATVPVFIAAWFAPPLIVFRAMTTWHAIRWSIYACIANLGAIILYGLICVIPIIATAVLPGVLSIPMSLIVTPIFFATVYASYRDVFADGAA